MKKTQKKEIRVTVENAMNQALTTLEIESPSKKTKKVINKVSKKMVGEVKRALKKKTKQAAKAVKPSKKNGKASTKADAAAHKIEAA